MNHKNERILKQFRAGITDPERLARKTGLPVARINEGLAALVARGEIWQSVNSGAFPTKDAQAETNV